jgi:hypothetical protein
METGLDRPSYCERPLYLKVVPHTFSYNRTDK